MLFIVIFPLLGSGSNDIPGPATITSDTVANGFIVSKVSAPSFVWSDLRGGLVSELLDTAVITFFTPILVSSGYESSDCPT